MVSGKVQTDIERRAMTRHAVRNHPGFCWEMDVGNKNGEHFCRENRLSHRRYFRRKERQRLRVQTEAEVRRLRARARRRIHLTFWERYYAALLEKGGYSSSWARLHWIDDDACRLQVWLYDHQPDHCGHG